MLLVLVLSISTAGLGTTEGSNQVDPGKEDRSSIALGRAEIPRDDIPKSGGIDAGSEEHSQAGTDAGSQHPQSDAEPEADPDPGSSALEQLIQIICHPALTWPCAAAVGIVTGRDNPACPNGESGGRAWVVSPDDQDWGLFQVDRGNAARFGGTAELLLDPWFNTWVAYNLWLGDGGSWRQWPVCGRAYG